MVPTVGATNCRQLRFLFDAYEKSGNKLTGAQPQDPLSVMYLLETLFQIPKTTVWEREVKCPRVYVWQQKIRIGIRLVNHSSCSPWLMVTTISCYNQLSTSQVLPLVHLVSVRSKQCVHQLPFLLININRITFQNKVGMKLHNKVIPPATLTFKNGPTEIVNSPTDEKTTTSSGVEHGSGGVAWHGSKASHQCSTHLVHEVHHVHAGITNITYDT